MRLRKIGFSFRDRHREEAASSSRTSANPTNLALAAPPIPAPKLLLPGDQPPPLSAGQKVSPLEVRNLNELIRKRYALDVEIWSKRHCRPRDRLFVEDKMQRADAVLEKIMLIVRMWDDSSAWESHADWNRLRRIKQSLEMEGGQRLWANNPPWES